jgi:hypothetical protein
MESGTSQQTSCGSTCWSRQSHLRSGSKERTSGVPHLFLGHTPNNLRNSHKFPPLKGPQYLSVAPSWEQTFLYVPLEDTTLVQTIAFTFFYHLSPESSPMLLAVQCLKAEVQKLCPVFSLFTVGGWVQSQFIMLKPS